MILDIRADHRNQTVRRCDGETPLEAHHPDSRRKWVRRSHVFLPCKERPVQERHGYHAVEFQVFQLPRMGHSRSDEPDGHRGDQVDEDSESKRRQHDHQVFAAQAVQAGQQAPVDDVHADLDQDAREHGIGNRLDIGSESKHQRQQEQRKADARHAGTTARSDVGHRQHRRPGAGQPSEQTRNHVADALPHQLAIRFVLRPGHRVGNQGDEQAVHGTEQGEDERRLQRARQEAGGRQRELQLRHPGRYLPNDGRIAQPQHAQQGAGDQRHQWRGQEIRQAAGPEKTNRQRHGRDREGAGIDVAERLRQCAKRRYRTPGSHRHPQKRHDLDQYDDDADAGHEA